MMSNGIPKSCESIAGAAVGAGLGRARASAAGPTAAEPDAPTSSAALMKMTRRAMMVEERQMRMRMRRMRQKLRIAVLAWPKSPAQRRRTGRPPSQSETRLPCDVIDLVADGAWQYWWSACWAALPMVWLEIQRSW